MMIVPEAVNMPATPRQTEILVPGMAFLDVWQEERAPDAQYPPPLSM